MKNNKEENENLKEDLQESNSEELTEKEMSEDLDSDVRDEESISDLENVMLERDDLKDKLMRSLAENENIRKRAIKEKSEAEIYGITRMSRDILSVYDNLQRALDLADDILDEKSLPIIEGLELTKKDLLDTLRRNKIQEIAPKSGDKFDPKLHQAMFKGPSETVEKGSIMQVISIGFSIGDRLLRASHVAVSSGSPKQKPGEDSIEKS